MTKMSIPLLSFSKYEHSLVERASIDLGKHFINAHDSVLLTYSFLKGVKPQALLFHSFLRHIKNTFVLCFLSAIRGHDIQLHMMLRHSFETVALASYSLFDTEEKTFYTKNEDGTVNPDDKVRSEAYKWLAKNYGSQSKIFKDWRDLINDNYAHADIVSVPSYPFIHECDLNPKLTNQVNDSMRKRDLWCVGNVSLATMNLFYLIIQDYPIVTLANDFPERGCSKFCVS